MTVVELLVEHKAEREREAEEAAEAMRNRSFPRGSQLLVLFVDEMLELVLAHVGATGMASVECTCQRFRNLVSVTARRLVEGRPRILRDWVPWRRGEKWVRLLHELELLEAPLIFSPSRVHPSIVLTKGGAKASSPSVGWSYRPPPIPVAEWWCAHAWRPAFCGPTMRNGIHRAEVTIHSDGMFIGAISQAVVANGLQQPDREPQYEVPAGWQEPTWDQEQLGGYYLYNTCGGKAYRTNPNASVEAMPYDEHTGHDWEGREGAIVRGERLGMHLDLAEGTLTLFRNGRRLGRPHSGLTGGLVWAVWLGSAEEGGEDTVRIRSLRPDEEFQPDPDSDSDSDSE